MSTVSLFDTKINGRQWGRHEPLKFGCIPFFVVHKLKKELKRIFIEYIFEIINNTTLFIIYLISGADL